MKISELIKILSALPQNLEVMVCSEEYYDCSVVVGSIDLMHVDDDGAICLANDVHQEPNAISICGVI